MQITVTATLPTQEYIDILAKMKGYNEVIFWEPNQESKEEFLRKVYDAFIQNDIANEYIKNAIANRESERITEEQAIRDLVSSSITSSIS